MNKEEFIKFMKKVYLFSAGAVFGFVFEFYVIAYQQGIWNISFIPLFLIAVVVILINLNAGRD